MSATPGIKHTINRNNIFEDVIDLYQTQNQLENEYPLYIEFTGERAIDTGGVTRDMFSGFFNECYMKFFDGGVLLTPIIHPHTDISKLTTIGAIISHSYLISGSLPVRIAFPTLAAILLGPATVVPQSMLLEAFVENLSAHESGLLKQAFNCSAQKFSLQFSTELLDILSVFGCREMPCPVTLKRIVLDVAKFEFLLKPATAVAMMHSGLLPKHQEFWSQLSIFDLHDVYVAQTVSPVRVLSMIEEPSCSTPNEERVMTYLRRFVGSMSQDELHAFIRFVTGASMCMVKKITVTFNSTDGFARRPTSHCCDCILELPSTYATYPEFVCEFRCILSHNQENYNWIMDAI